MSLPRTILNTKEIANFFLLRLLLIFTFGGFFTDAVTVKKVAAGHLAELPCPSIDDKHIFSFWQLTDDKNVIGPGNPHDENKYDYEVLTGKLMIRGVSTAESGFYKCVARGMEDASAINVHIIELVVSKAWKEVEEIDYEVDLIATLFIIMVIVVGIAAVLYVITTKHSIPSHTFEDLEESREQTPVTYLPPIVVQAPVIETPSPLPQTSTALDSFGMEVDFPRVFQQMQERPSLL